MIQTAGTGYVAVMTDGTNIALKGASKKKRALELLAQQIGAPNTRSCTLKTYGVSSLLREGRVIPLGKEPQERPRNSARSERTRMKSRRLQNRFIGRTAA